MTFGEAMLRLSVPMGTRLEQAERLALHVAGAEANTAIALAQLGRSVTWISRLPDTPLGRRVGREFKAHGVDISHVRWVPDGRIGLYFVELAASPQPVRVVYDRIGSTAAGISVDDLPADIVDSVRVVYLSGITPALSDSCRRAALQLADRARASSSLLTIDINYRARLWSPDVARECLIQLATGADVVVLTREDARDVFGLVGEPAKVVRDARNVLAADSLVLTLGDQGSIWESDAASGRVEAVPTVIVDRLGAGDAFMAGVIDGLIDGDLTRGLRIGTVLASLALSAHGDHPVITRTEVDRLLDGFGRAIDR